VRRPYHREYPQHSSVFCSRAACALPPFRFYDRRSADWSPNCWGAVRGVNRSGAGACLRGRDGMAQKASETRSDLRLSKSGLDGQCGNNAAADTFLTEDTGCSGRRIGGSDGTRTRGLLRGRRSNQLNYAPAYRRSFHSFSFPPMLSASLPYHLAVP
jgi:hypothetical protein